MPPGPPAKGEALCNCPLAGDGRGPTVASQGLFRPSPIPQPKWMVQRATALGGDPRGRSSWPGSGAAAPALAWFTPVRLPRGVSFRPAAPSPHAGSTVAAPETGVARHPEIAFADDPAFSSLRPNAQATPVTPRGRGKDASTPDVDD